MRLAGRKAIVESASILGDTLNLMKAFFYTKVTPNITRFTDKKACAVTDDFCRMGVMY